MRVVLDTNCLLDAADENSNAYPSLQEIISAGAAGLVELCVSRHSLSELCKDEPVTQRARFIAGKMTSLPHYPIGSWDEQVATWDQASGTWDDVRDNQALQIKVVSLAKAGIDIRDCGAYIDAIRAKADAFVTSDRQLAAGVPATRLKEAFGLRVLTPAGLAKQFNA